MANKDDFLLIHEDAFWDAIVSDQTAFHQIDPTTASTIARAHAIDNAGPPDPAFVHSLRETLLQSAQVSERPAGRVRLLSRPKANVFRSHRFGGNDRDWPLRWKAIGATAFLVLIAIGIFLGITEFGTDNSGRFAAEPTIAAPTAVPLQPVSDAFFQITLPAASIPTGPNVTSGVAIDVIPVGISATWVPDCCPGPTVECPVSGSMSVQGNAASQVERVDGSIETVPANAAVTIGTGDCLVSDNGTTSTYTNVGADPVVLFHWMLIDTEDSFSGHFPSGWATLSQPDIIGPLDLVSAPVLVQIRMVPMQDGEILQPSVVGLQLVALAELNARIVTSDEGVKTVFGAKIGSPVTAYIVTFQQSGPHPATATP